MTKDEYLLQCLSEECVEVSQRVSKAIRFGLDEVQPGQVIEFTNRQRIKHELCDLFGVIHLLVDSDVLPKDWMDFDAIGAKVEKIKEFLQYSRELGIVVVQKTHKGYCECGAIIIGPDEPHDQDCPAFEMIAIPAQVSSSTAVINRDHVKSSCTVANCVMCKYDLPSRDMSDPSEK